MQQANAAAETAAVWMRTASGAAAELEPPAAVAGLGTCKRSREVPAATPVVRI